MLAGAFAGIAVRFHLCRRPPAPPLTSLQEHSVMYPVDLLKVGCRSLCRRADFVPQR